MKIGHMTRRDERWNYLLLSKSVTKYDILIAIILKGYSETFTNHFQLVFILWGNYLICKYVKPSNKTAVSKLILIWLFMLMCLMFICETKRILILDLEEGKRQKIPFPYAVWYFVNPCDTFLHIKSLSVSNRYIAAILPVRRKTTTNVFSVSFPCMSSFSLTFTLTLYQMFVRIFKAAFILKMNLNVVLRFLRKVVNTQKW